MMLLSTPVIADFQPEGWHLKAQNEVRSLYVGLVHYTIWSQKLSFWATATNKGFSMDPFAENVMCAALKRARQPEGEMMIVSAWDSREFQNET